MWSCWSPASALHRDPHFAGRPTFCAPPIQRSPAESSTTYRYPAPATGMGMPTVMVLNTDQRAAISRIPRFSKAAASKTGRPLKDDPMLKLVLVVGARPNFMKAAPILFELRRHPGEFRCILVHTGQHYDAKMSDVFFHDLDLPAPDKFLGVGSGTHAVQTAQTMLAFEPVLLAERPDWVIVVGDVNSTIACALVAVKLGIPV